MNQLKNESSAYLKQHASNPVHWWPYGKEALEKAKETNKPIFLSIGYSSCHWCHVMAHESFEDKGTADYLNENFINIKVDREEFPDIDQYYQKACFFFGRSGGWPLNAFLTPDMKPYYVGTYFPLQKQGEMPAFREVLNELVRAYEHDHETVLENSTKATEYITTQEKPESKVDVQGHFAHPSAVFDALKQYQDNQFGGYGTAPKFPSFSYWEWASEQMAEGMIQKDHQEFMVKTMDHMLFGGIYDQAKGGYHRYSTDDQYLIPHFEKMLYDQAGFIKLLSKLSLSYPAPHVYDSLIQTLDYLESEMLSDEGYFFSAQDADSEGTEGLYFTFSIEEFEDAMNAREIDEHMDSLKKWFSITAQGNFEEGLHAIHLNPEYKDEFLQVDNWNIIRQAKDALLEARKKRIPPMTDSKGVASWNFMLMSSLVDVIQYCRIPVIKQKAHHLINKAIEGAHKNFLIPSPGEKDGKTMIRHTTTKNMSLPYFEDYVNFCEMQLRLYEFSANDSFRDNFLDTMSFVKQEFYKENKFYTRALQSNDTEYYQNIPMDIHDSSFASTVCIYLGLVRRYSLLVQNTELEDSLKDMYEEVKQVVLRNPLSSGQGLRALTYPKEAYRTVKAPKSWAKEDTFINFVGVLLPRFVIQYTEQEQAWEICSATECQMQGEGLDNMIKTLSPQEKQE